MAPFVVLIKHYDAKGASMELMCARQVSELTGVPVGTLRYWRHANLGPASFTLGRRVVYRRNEVERWIAEQEAATRRGGGDAA
jgi:predicted DNA-binding transcriptional regulator AlpA